MLEMLDTDLCEGQVVGMALAGIHKVSGHYSQSYGLIFGLSSVEAGDRLNDSYEPLLTWDVL